MEEIAQIPVFILCGGLGTRIREETEFRPKPMVPIGERPILWHIMHRYRGFGFRRFILCSGYKSDVIKSYFLNYASMNSDFTVNLKNNHLTIHSIDHDEDWEVTVAHTGEECMTGGRLAKASRKYLGEAEHAAVTYGDGLADVDLVAEFKFHRRQNKIGTLLGVNPPSRFGEIALNGEEVIDFCEKPTFKESWINGGFFFFKREFFTRYLPLDETCVLEKGPLAQLAKEKQLAMYKHHSFWACMDTQRDRDLLTELWKTGKAPWAHSLPSIHTETLKAEYHNPALMTSKSTS